jgi:uncharacterized membrane protein YecN with MAPEG domain
VTSEAENVDDRHVIYNTTVIGLLFVVVCWTTLWLIRPDEASLVLTWLDERVVSHKNGVSEAIARWIAVGVAASFLGMVIQVISVIWYQHRHNSDDARKEFADYVRKEMASTVCFEKIRHQIEEGTDDSLFAFYHYSHSPKDLIDWGRTRKRYNYVGENWGVVIIGGIISGGAIAFSITMAKTLPNHPENKALIVTLFIVIIVLAMLGLNELRKYNERSVNAMDAAVMASLLKKFTNCKSKWTDGPDKKITVVCDLGRRCSETGKSSDTPK